VCVSVSVSVRERKGERENVCVFVCDSKREGASGGARVKGYG